MPPSEHSSYTIQVASSSDRFGTSNLDYPANLLSRKTGNYGDAGFGATATFNPKLRNRDLYINGFNYLRELCKRYPVP
jgi:hypothetical protein